MSFPAVSSITATTSTSSTTSYSVSMPATVNSGDLLLMIVGSNMDDTQLINTPSGWTAIYRETLNGGMAYGIFAKNAAGTEGGTTVTVTYPVTVFDLAAQVYRITGWKNSGTLANDVEVAHAQSTDPPDPPSLNPTNWAAEDTLWIAGFTLSINISVSGYPTNYTNGTLTTSGDVALIATARRNLNANSDDPGTFSNGSFGGNCQEFTIAVRPSVAGAADRKGQAAWAEVEAPDTPGNFPVVEDIATSGDSSSASTYYVVMPTTVMAGELLLMYIVFGTDTAAAINTPAGWTLSGTGGLPSVQHGQVWALFLKKAIGTEGGSIVTVTTTLTVDSMSVQVYRISGWKASGIITNDVEIASATDNVSATPDPPALNPTNWDVENTLWLVFVSRGAYFGVFSYPTNYLFGNFNSNNVSAIASCRRELAAASEDPGVLTTGNSNYYSMVTVAVRPATGSVSRTAIVRWGEFETPLNAAAAFPKVEDITETRELIASSTFVINYPATVNVGDLFLLFIGLGSPSIPNTIQTPAGWTAVGGYGDNLNFAFWCIARPAVGNEDGTTLTVTLDGNAQGKTAQLYRISNWFNNSIPTDVQADVQFQSTTQPDPRNLTPTWGLDSTLWIAWAGGDISSYTAGDIPVNYTNGVLTASAQGRNTQISGRRQLLAASENPGSFSILLATGRVVVMTVGIRPFATAADRRGRTSYAEFEISAPPDRRSRMTWAELQTPDVSKKGQVSFAELQTPDQPTNRRGLVKWSELQTPDLNRRGNVGWAQVETPNATITPPAVVPFILLVEQDVAIEISLFNDPNTSWSQSSNTYTYSLGTRNIIGFNRKEIASVSLNGKEYTQVNSLSQVNVDGESFVYLAATNQISINPTSIIPGGGTTSPNTAIVFARFRMRWSNYAVDFEGNAYESRLLQPNQADASIKLSVDDEFMEPSVIVAGSYTVANANLPGEFYTIDQLLRDYIIAGQKVTKREYNLATGEVQDLTGGSAYVGEIGRIDLSTVFTLWN